MAVLGRSDALGVHGVIVMLFRGRTLWPRHVLVLRA